MKGFHERVWVLTGGRQGRVWLVCCHRLRRGGGVSVEADWGWALRREEHRGDVMGFLHTHPPGAGVAPSRRDVRTMHAWCSCLGKPLLCIIRCGDKVRATLFSGPDKAAQPLAVTELFQHGLVVVVSR